MPIVLPQFDDQTNDMKAIFQSELNRNIQLAIFAMRQGDRHLWSMTSSIIVVEVNSEVG